jgi:hypothetical protein
MSDERPVARLAGVNVWSPAPQAAAGLLEGALGITLRERMTSDGPHFSGRAENLTLSLHPGGEAGAELAFVVDDAESAVAACTARGSRVISGPTREPYGLSTHLAGPGALRVELVELTTEDT